jgi:N-acetylglucosaminyldiphosphoundecaprenol N-acetyl-beta-D-mannosaminyltransferase
MMQPIQLSATDASVLGATAVPPRWDDLSREVYCLLGMPIDAIDLATFIKFVEDAGLRRASFLISTPNLNFLVKSHLDAKFREALLHSELCPADGMPIVWIARLLGIPIRERAAGSDMFEMLKGKDRFGTPLTLCLFGGASGIVDAATKAINEDSRGLRCVSAINPGFGTVEEMSRDDIIEKINMSRADFLVVALSADKGQQWLLQNGNRLQIPIRAQLGAVINFTAGNVKRAPRLLRKLGFEWLWRIKEEPHLWRRYWHDGVTLAWLMTTRVMPLIVGSFRQRLFGDRWRNLAIGQSQDREAFTLTLSGAATAQSARRVIPLFRGALATKKAIRIDLSGACAIDARFLGLCMMLKKLTMKQGTDLQFIGASLPLRRSFRLHGVDYLLSPNQTR